MVYRVAISDFNTATNMAELQKDIKMFNPRLRLAILPRWVIFKVSRISKMHELMILSFDNEEMY
jgi:hypothetical protein